MESGDEPRLVEEHPAIAVVLREMLEDPLHHHFPAGPVLADLGRPEDLGHPAEADAILDLVAPDPPHEAGVLRSAGALDGVVAEPRLDHPAPRSHGQAEPGLSRIPAPPSL